MNLARLLFSTFGSFGDLYPYLALGREMRLRGHEITLATSESYRTRVEQEGLAFHPVRPDVSLEDREMLAYVMDAKRGTERIVRYLASLVRESYQDTYEAVSKADLVLTHPITFAAVLAARKLGKPWVSSVLAPISFLSPHDPPVLAPAPWLYRVCRVLPPLNRVWMEPAKRHTKSWLRPLLQFQEQLGLGDVGNPLFEGQHSPRLVLAMFSRHFGAPQPDWPPQTLATGFPDYQDGRGMPDNLLRFLNNGSAPIVFTLGSSAVGAARNFYVDSLAAVERLGLRAVLLTGSHPQGLPSRLPESVLAVPYAPHKEIFSKAVVIVHQGGIGTTAQGLRAGHPTLVVPFAHDQYDNAERVRRLGAGEVLPEPHYRAERVEVILRRLFGDFSYRQAASEIAGKIRREDGCRSAADAIEAVLRSEARGTGSGNES